MQSITHLLIALAGYGLLTGCCFCGSFRATGLMPWEISWVFSSIAPILGFVGFLTWQIAANRFCWWSLALFLVTAALLGWYWHWLGLDLAGSV